MPGTAVDNSKDMPRGKQIEENLMLLWLLPRTDWDE